MADTGDRDVNLSALQRVDPYIVEVLNSATQVALYKYASDFEWDKTGVEGTLFVYRRSAPPFYGFLIMNRLSKTNQVEPITKELILKRDDPYLLYRNFKLDVFGIWFYEYNDCILINDAINRLLNDENENTSNEKSRWASESDSNNYNSGINNGSDNNLDIVSMLTKAQEDYLKKSNSDPKPIVESPIAGAAAAASADLVRPRAVRVNSSGAPDVTKITNVSESNLNNEKQLTIEDLFARASCAESLRVQTNKEFGRHNPILQRLMSNPENLVEHIEKRQRNEGSHLTHFPEEKSIVVAEISTSSPIETNCLMENCTSPKGSQSDSIFTPAMFENALSIPDLSTPLMSPSKQPPPLPPATLHMSLMSPMMFSTPESFTNERKCPPARMDFEESEIQPLTKTQFVQAFIHLLKNDSAFISNLHEAYVKTLPRRDSNNSLGKKSNGLLN